MNKKTGIYASVIIFTAVLGFALCMIIGTNNGSYISSMFIAWGFVPLICTFAACAKKEVKAVAYTAMAFAAIYGMLIAIVYFTQLTTVRVSELSEQTSILLDYSKFNLFFSYNLLGYAFMALSTFFTSLTLEIKDKGDKWLKAMLMFHGVFAIGCVVLPIIGVFKTGMEGGDLIGTLVLEIWCIYFMPICLLSYRYFKKQ